MAKLGSARFPQGAESSEAAQNRQGTPKRGLDKIISSTLGVTHQVFTGASQARENL